MEVVILNHTWECKHHYEIPLRFKRIYSSGKKMIFVNYENFDQKTYPVEKEYKILYSEESYSPKCLERNLCLCFYNLDKVDYSISKDTCTIIRCNRNLPRLYGEGGVDQSECYDKSDEEDFLL